MRNRRRLFLLVALIVACIWLGFKLGTEQQGRGYRPPPMTPAGIHFSLSNDPLPVATWFLSPNTCINIPEPANLGLFFT